MPSPLYRPPEPAIGTPWAPLCNAMSTDLLFATAVDHGQACRPSSGRGRACSAPGLQQMAAERQQVAPLALAVPRLVAQLGGLTREQLLEEENAYLKARVAYLEKARALLASKPTTGRSR